MPRKKKQPSPGYKALAEIIIDGVFKGAKHIYNNVRAQEQTKSPPPEPELKKPNLPRIARYE